MRGRRLRPSDGKYRNGSYSQSDNRSRARSGANIVYLPARTRRATAKRPLDITPICPAPQTQADMPPTHVRGGNPLDWPGLPDPISTFGHFKRNLVSKGRSRLTKPQLTHGANWGLLRVMRLKCPKVECSLPARGESLICMRSQRCSSYASSRRATSSIRIVSPCFDATTVTSMNTAMSVM